MTDTVMRQVRKDDPLMIAWQAYVGGEEYQNSFMWASHEEHRDGSLWAAFMAGFRAAQATEGNTPAPAGDAVRAALAAGRDPAFSNEFVGAALRAALGEG
jgi:hypothetical protein